MARQLRIEFPGAIYHVMSRGQQRQHTFRQDHDYEAFKERLKKAVARYGLELYAYCLMPNHYHLFLSTPEGNLQVAMQWLGTAYTVWYNRRHRRSGHLFQGRYKAQLVEDESYFAEVTRYLHLNPVRSRLARQPQEWPWSSYRGYWRKRYEEPFVSYESVLGTFSEEMKVASRRYRQFVDEGCSTKLVSPWHSAWHGFILGSDAFLDKLARLVRDRFVGAERDVALSRNLRKRFSIGEVVEAVAREAGMRVGELTRRSQGRGNKARKLAIALCRHVCAARSREIARAFQLSSESRVSELAKGVDLKEPLVQAVISRLQPPSPGDKIRRGSNF